MNKKVLDLDRKELELGHIVAVRYVWNSYAGVIRLQGLSLYEFADRFKGAALYHRVDNKSTYQILGHVDKDHPDYREDIIHWIKSEEGECPIKIKVYQNV